MVEEEHGILTFFKIFARLVLFVGPLMRLYWTSGDVSSGFQSQSGQPYSHLAETYILHIFLRFSSGVTPADLLVASMAAELFSSTYLRDGIYEARNWDLLGHVHSVMQTL